jgi:hypothetical protein
LARAALLLLLLPLLQPTLRMWVSTALMMTPAVCVTSAAWMWLW